MRPPIVGYPSMAEACNVGTMRANLSRSAATVGSAPLLTVMFTLLLLSSILAVTLRLSLSSRQNTADQTGILSAQYAAESEMNLLRSRFKDIQDLLSNPTSASNYLRLPPGSLQAELNAYALNFCGKAGSTTAWVETSEFANPRSGTDTDSFPNAEQCVNDQASVVTNERYGVLADAVDNARYAAVLPAAERPAVGATRAQKIAWWNQLMARDTARARYVIEPARVVNLNGNRYRFYLRIARAVAVGESGTARRYLSAQNTEQTDWWFEFEVPNPFENVVFDNEIPDTGAFTTNVFDGDYFTNQKIRVYSTSNVQFRGKFRSAGCNSGTFPADNAAPGTDCSSKSPGFYNGTNLVDTPATGVTNINNALKTSLDAFADFAPNKQVDFQAAYIKLPMNASQQLQDATNAGLVLNSTETGVSMVVGDSNGNALPASAFNANQQKWNEPSPVYQYIRLQGPVQGYDTTQWSRVSQSTYNQTPNEYRTQQCSRGRCTYYVRPTITTTETVREFRYGPNMTLQQKQGTSWVTVRQNFNGVIYTGNDVSVNGPPRLDGSTSGDLSKMPPAIASFAKVNVTGNGDIKIASDLTLSNLPCQNDTYGGTTCEKDTYGQVPQNILGLFTPNGDISISTKAPNNVTVYSAMMSSRGGLGVDDYNRGSHRGTMKIIGSVVENSPGLKGTSGNVRTGYTPSYTYDNRFKVGILPPSSPVTMVWKALDGSIADKALPGFTWTQVTEAEFE